MSTESLIKTNQELKIEELSCLDYLELYSYFIELGTELELPNDDCEIVEMEGCQHKVTIAYWMADERMYFCGSSDSRIMKGIIHQLSLIVSGHYPNEIAESNIFIFDRIGIKSNVSTLRQAGIDKIVETFKEMARNEKSA